MAAEKTWAEVQAELNPAPAKTTKPRNRKAAPAKVADPIADKAPKKETAPAAAKTAAPPAGDAEPSKRTSGVMYSRATTALREAHAEEFDVLLAQAYAAAGVEYKRRRTPEEAAADKKAAALAKATEQMKALTEKFGAEALRSALGLDA
jgi:hypothetical protein